MALIKQYQPDYTILVPVTILFFLGANFLSVHNWLFMLIYFMLAHNFACWNEGNKYMRLELPLFYVFFIIVYTYRICVHLLLRL